LKADEPDIFTTEVTEDTEVHSADEAINRLTHEIIGAAIEVHRTLGPGLLESTYEACLAHELQVRGLSAQKQMPLPIVYKEVRLDCAYRLDFVVEKKVIVELKSVDALAPIHEAQLLSYLKLSGIKYGLLINFNVEVLRQGIKRIAH
jgi:GxxExxY protein